MKQEQPIKAEWRDESGINFYVSEPNSHFWTSIEMLLNWSKHQPHSDSMDELMIGLRNTINKGYSLNAPEPSEDLDWEAKFESWLLHNLTKANISYVQIIIDHVKRYVIPSASKATVNGKEGWAVQNVASYHAAREYAKATFQSKEDAEYIQEVSINSFIEGAKWKESTLSPATVSNGDAPSFQYPAQYPNELRKRAVSFGKWQSGMNLEQVDRAYSRFIKESGIKETTSSIQEGESRWDAEKQIGYYSDKIHHGEMKVKPQEGEEKKFTLKEMKEAIRFGADMANAFCGFPSELENYLSEVEPNYFKETFGINLEK